MGTAQEGKNAWTRLLEVLQPAFSSPGWRLFEPLMVGWALCTGRKTITGIYGASSRPRAHDAFHRFVRCGAWNSLALWEMLAKAMVKALWPRTTILECDLDDTLLHKTGPKVSGAGFWRDAVRSVGKRVVTARGLNVLVVTLRIRPPWGGEPLGLPILVLLHRKEGEKLTTMAAQAVERVTSWFPGRHIRWCADGAYAAVLIPMGNPLRTVISRLRRDAAIYDLPPEPTGKRGRPRRKGKRLGTPQQIARRARKWTPVETEERGNQRNRLVNTRKVLWYTVSKTPVDLVISRDPEGKEHDDFWVCSGAQLPPAEVIGAYAGRWSIEDTFRATKQTLGIQHPQSWAGNAPERAATLGFLLYALIWWWFLALPKKRHRIRTTPWYPSKTTPSFVDALATLRGDLWRARISSASDSGPLAAEIQEVMLAALARAG